MECHQTQKMKTLTTDQKKQIAAFFGLEYKTVSAVMTVESSGHGFDPVTGLILIQFEPYIFHKQLLAAKIDHKFEVIYKVVNGIKKIDKYKITTGEHIIINGIEGQTSEWIAYNIALQINANCAMLSTSFGLGQIMGFNFNAAGFLSVEKMIEKFNESEAEQLMGMLKFITANKLMFAFLKCKTWDKFAALYNGPAYKENNYDIRLQTAYDRA